MMGNALIAERDGRWVVKAPVKLRAHGAVTCATSIVYFPALDAARAYCLCCDYAYTLAVQPFDLEPPAGAA